jgi:hypothetical protein
VPGSRGPVAGRPPEAPRGPVFVVVVCVLTVREYVFVSVVVPPVVLLTAVSSDFWPKTGENASTVRSFQIIQPREQVRHDVEGNAATHKQPRQGADIGYGNRGGLYSTAVVVVIVIVAAAVVRGQGLEQRQDDQGDTVVDNGNGPQ